MPSADAFVFAADQPDGAMGCRAREAAYQRVCDRSASAARSLLTWFIEAQMNFSTAPELMRFVNFIRLRWLVCDVTRSLRRPVSALVQQTKRSTISLWHLRKTRHQTTGPGKQTPNLTGLYFVRDTSASFRQKWVFMFYFYFRMSSPKINKVRVGDRRKAICTAAVLIELLPTNVLIYSWQGVEKMVTFTEW